MRLNLNNIIKSLTFLLYFTLSINVLIAADKNFGDLKHISVSQGLTEYQYQAVKLSGFLEKLKTNTNKSFVPFDLMFRSASVDLNNDGIDEVFVSVQNLGWCGSGGCHIDILINDLEWIEAGTFRPEYFYVSDQTKYGLRVIYYETNCRTNIDETICDFYKVEPTSSNSYAGGSVFLVKKDKPALFGYGNLTEIYLKPGLTNKQSKEVAIGLADDLNYIFNYWLTESHFIYYPRCSNENSQNCRQNLIFDVDFSAASLDLDNDGVDDLLVRIEHEIWCGVGACDKIDILLNGDIVGIKAGILGGSRYYVSDKTLHGLRYLFFETDCRINIDEENICDFYMLEPTNSEQYSKAILVEKGRQVE